MSCSNLPDKIQTLTDDIEWWDNHIKEQAARVERNKKHLKALKERQLKIEQAQIQRIMRNNYKIWLAECVNKCYLAGLIDENMEIIEK